ncbi:RNP-1 like RNA-binding protein [Halothece sp. PCC 7418]|uniref:RNA recognition motif domain-containing protein n=1 Tax=Halothece sp. (strain PCC 7418) TaxID=65093 RepID=UPI0002A0683D|nr:RNA-binding protein [Halothece sp. PCC 7418]AFZ42690.1 RNP-1 like RNA-binding protein [Halothece sp. PCC 7418]
MSVRLYVGNLPKDTVERQELQEVFGEADESLSIKVIKDRKTGNCRGFAFVTVPNDEKAEEIIEKYNGQTFRENALKIEKAQPRNKNKGDENAAEGGEKEGSEARESSRPTKQKNKEGGSKRRGKGNKKSKQPATTSSGNTSNQPDPRWADELAKLKEMLSAVEK